jgi:EAL domain-containing protein (putative c-di-GMP-specific phosphodiesterase class I)
MGCDVVLGFLFGRPTTAAQITELMTSDRPITGDR